jgi:hypothetical protein
MNQIDNCVDVDRDLTDLDIESLAGQLDTSEETVQSWVDEVDGVNADDEDAGETEPSDEGA